MVVMVEEEATPLTTTMLTTPLTVLAVVAAAASVDAALTLQVWRLGLLFLCAERKHKFSFNIVITKMFKDV